VLAFGRSTVSWVVAAVVAWVDRTVGHAMRCSQTLRRKEHGNGDRSLLPPSVRGQGLLKREMPDGMLVYDEDRHQAHRWLPEYRYSVDYL
jgi:hypothetical protein